jgi:hypothetical protein
MSALRDLTGQKFGLLTVLGRAPNSKHGHACWHCVCEDGTKKVILGDSLISGSTRSCGCLNDTEHRSRRTTKHGHSRRGQESPEYTSWRSMKDRVLNPNHKDYAYYGGRGIKIHPPWIDSFEAFLAYVGPRPSSKHTLERINNDGNYEPGNVEWHTRKDQAENRRTTHRIPLPHGRVVSITRLSRELGLPDQKLLGIVFSAKRSIARGATMRAEQATKIGIQLIFWMLLAGMLKGSPDHHNAPVRALLLCLRNTARARK